MSRVQINSIAERVRLGAREKEGGLVSLQEGRGGEAMQGKGVVESVVARWCDNCGRRLGNRHEEKNYF